MIGDHLKDRYRGSLLGLAVGDALGTTLEFKAPGTFEPLSEMVGGGPFKLQPGQWTDDTSMALCLAESLVECNGFDPQDQMERYRRWYREGYLSSTDTCFDIGNTVRSAIHAFEKTGEAYSGSTDLHSAGNGSIMRLAPVSLFYGRQPQKAIECARESSRTTHGTQAALDACEYLAGLILGAFAGLDKEELLAPYFSPIPGRETQKYSSEIDAVAAGSYKTKHPPEIRGSGYVVESLEAALWAFHRSSSFEEGALMAVNLGDDADTTGAVYGQLAGAFYGASGIPQKWVKEIAKRTYIEQLVAQLLDAAEKTSAEKVAAVTEKPLPLPFERSYWGDPGHLLAGYYPGAPTKQEAAQKLGALLDVGVRCIVNLVEEEEKGWNGKPLRPYYQLLAKIAAERNIEITYTRIPIRDTGIPSQDTMRTILGVIDTARSSGQPVYVHCWGGKGRTGTVVGCYLVRHGLALGEDALKEIKHLRRHEPKADEPSPENESQRNFVRSWQQGQ